MQDVYQQGVGAVVSVTAVDSFPMMAGLEFAPCKMFDSKAFCEAMRVAAVLQPIQWYLGDV